MIGIDARGKIRVFNSTYENLCGYWAEEVLSHDAALLLPESYRGEDVEERARRGNASETCTMGVGREAVARRKDGSIIRCTFPSAKERWAVRMSLPSTI
jgi:two-component system sensor kinase FixL